jgi:hypothetical protein
LTWTGDGSWTVRRLWISSFLVFHLVATVGWVLPRCAIRDEIVPWARYYMLPLGLWQSWAMFAPDPVRDTVTLEAEVIDANGVRYEFAFPRMADYTWWQDIPRFRYSKYAANLSGEEFALARRFAASHVLRRLKLPAEVYPVSVHLMYQSRVTPPPGSPLPAIDPMSPTKPLVVGTVQIDNAREVQP